MPSANVFNELCVKISLLRSIPEKIITVCNAVYFRLCIDMMHILPPVTAEGFDGSHHPRFAECIHCCAEFSEHARYDTNNTGSQHSVFSVFTLTKT